MSISLIIPAYNEESSIGACIEAAIKNGKGKYKEIIVVDNASTDNTAAVAGRYPDVRVISETRKGTGHARQTGTENAQGEILAYVDADTRIPEGWFDYIEKVFSSDPKVVFLSGPYRYLVSTRYPLWFLNALWWVSPPIAGIVGFMAIGGNCAMRADALKSIGGHDRTIAFYGDDTDLARRLHKVGKTLWRMKFFIYTSGRRFDEKGIFDTCMQYTLNYWWPVLFHRPFTTGHHDIKRT